MKQYESLKHGTKDFPVGIHDTVCETGFVLYPHIHREFEFLVMCEGKGTVYIEEEKFEISAGEGIFINSEQLHIGVKTNGERAVFYAVVFAPEVFGASFADAVVRKYVEPVASGRVKFKTLIDKSVLDLLDRIHNNRECELIIKACLFEIWDICFKNAENKDYAHSNKNVEEMKRVMAYIRERFCDDITLDELARFANVSKGYLCRQFSAIVHMTPFEYLNEIRIDKSCDMLKNTSMTIGEIAESCGFNSFSYFSKVFREKMGCTPKGYRK